MSKAVIGMKVCGSASGPNAGDKGFVGRANDEYSSYAIYWTDGPIGYLTPGQAQSLLDGKLTGWELV